MHTHRFASFRYALAAVLATGMTITSHAADWPQFMGPGLNHRSAEKDLAVRFGPQGPKELWRVSVGKGYAGIAVAEGRAYTVGHSGEAKGGKETVYCFEVGSGRVLWKHSYAAELIPLYHSGGPNTTPTVHDGKVYTVSKDGQVHAYDAKSGKVLWAANLLKAMGLERMTRWGFSTAPRVDGDQLLFHCNRLLALNKDTGKVAMRSSSETLPGYSSVTVFTHGDKKYAAALGGDRLAVYERNTGDEVASFPFKVQFNTNCFTPAVVKEDGKTTIFISASNNTGRFTKLAFDGKSLKQVYTTKVLQAFMANPVLIDGYLYGISGKHKNRSTAMVCMRYSDGKEMWSIKGYGAGSLIEADGKLLIMSEDGRFVTAEATPDGFKKISEARVLPKNAVVWTPLTLANGAAYARNADGDLVALDLKK